MELLSQEHCDCACPRYYPGRGYVLPRSVGPCVTADTTATIGGARSFLLPGLILNGFHAAAAAIPRRLAICMAQALSQEPLFRMHHALRSFVKHHPHQADQGAGEVGNVG
jgi:hypothetical protein